jgi:hypothetical protein
MKMGCMKTCNQCGTKVKNQFNDFLSCASFLLSLSFSLSLSLSQFSHKKYMFENKIKNVIRSNFDASNIKY